MTMLGDVTLGLALLIYAVPLQLVRHDGAKRRPDGALVWGALLVLAPLWALLGVALCAATAAGGLEWIAVGRGAQYALAIAAALAMAVVAFFSLTLEREPASQVPWAARPLRGWAGLALPPVTIAGGLAALHPGWTEGVSAWAFRAPLAALAAMSLLACLGLLAQWIAVAGQRAGARAERSVAEQTERDRRMLAEVERLDPAKELGRLLDRTGPFETPAVREAALTRVRAHPGLRAELAAMLQNEWCIEALTFLEANDPPDAAGLAEPVRVALLRVAARVRREMANAHHLHDDSFDGDARRALAVADRFRGHGVDYTPAIRELRAALDTPRQQAIAPRARRSLDAWLAARARAR